MADRQLLKSYLPRALRTRIRQYAAKKGISESSVANAALIRYLDDANDGPLILRKLHRIDRNLERSRRDSDVLSEAFAVFVQLWFAHTPRLDDDEKPTAEHSALQRFSEFAEHVSEKVAGGASFLSDLIRDGAAEQDEISSSQPPRTGDPK
jgi:hypothetical protein